jgi:cation diffusion facilitator family transporter
MPHDAAHSPAAHSHVFLAPGHDGAERRTWAVIWLCLAMMVAEIGGGWLFGSIALIADGLHMSTHAGALLLAALAYRYARRHAEDGRFTFGTGKFGDLAGFTSAVILAMISLLIGYEAVGRLFAPVPIHFSEAIPIACLGLAVNVASVWLLSGGHGHDHGHSHGHHHHGHDHHGHESGHAIATASGPVILDIFEDGVPPRFRLTPGASGAQVETLRPDGRRQTFALRDCGGFMESIEEIPEPHAFEAELHLGGVTHSVTFAEPASGHAHTHAASRDNNMRAAVIHVIADAAVSVLVIAGLLLAKAFGWNWVDPVVGIAGAVVIASWAWGLVRDTGAILLDMNPDPQMERRLREAVESAGDQISDLHLWRLGPGHLGAIVCVQTVHQRDTAYYRARLSSFGALSHLTVEVHHSRKQPA